MIRYQQTWAFMPASMWPEKRKVRSANIPNARIMRLIARKIVLDAAIVRPITRGPPTRIKRPLIRPGM